MLSFLLRPGSFISQEQFCLSNCCRAKMILVGTYPGEFCPHKPLQSSVLDFLPPAPSWQGSWSSLWHPAHFLGDRERLWSWGPWRRSRVLGWGWASRWGASNTSLPRKVSEMQRGSTAIRLGIGMVCRSNCNTSKQGQSIPELVWLSGYPPLGYGKEGRSASPWVALGKGTPHLPVTLSWWRPQRKSCKYDPTLITAIERTLLEKDVWRCCVRGYLFTPTERTSLVKMTWGEESAFPSDFSVGDVI